MITTNALSSIPSEDLFSLLEQVAISSIELSRFDLAELCIQRLTSRFPSSQRVTSLQGMLLEGQNNLSAAIELYTEALEKEPTSLILSRRRIAALKSLGDKKRVVEALNGHLDVFYNDQEGWQELAEVYAEAGMYSQSAFALEEVLLQVPQNSFFHLKYAETLYTAGETGKAYKAYLRVLELCQSDGEQAKGGRGGKGPWVRGLWGTKMATTTLLAQTGGKGGEEAVDMAKVKKIDELVTNLLLNKVYTPSNVQDKGLRDVVRAVLAA